MSVPATPSFAARLWRWLTRPTRGQWLGAACFLALVIIGARWLLCEIIPAYLWSKDAGSYAMSAWTWLDTGQWITDPRRGPVYSVFIAACLKLWGGFWPLVLLQQVLGGLCVAVGIAVLFRLTEPRAWLVVTLCGYAYAVHASILQLSHLVRNETLLFVFATGTLVGWLLALRRDSLGWLVFTGLCLALLTMTKNVFTPLPLVIAAVQAWRLRKTWPWALAQVAVFLLAVYLPAKSTRFVERTWGQPQPPVPREGVLLFGRVAQFTVLDGGIEPEIKAIIRADIEDYRKRDELDNNIILYRTAVPHMTAYLTERGQTSADLNRLCLRFAIEAVRANGGAYGRQVIGDFWRLQTATGERSSRPTLDQLEDNIALLSRLDLKHPTLHEEETLGRLKAHANDENFRAYRTVVATNWLFGRFSVICTTLLLPLIWWRTRGELRWWWLGLAVVWYFNMVLLSTVGRPLERYLLPVTPIMFWTLGSALALAWSAATRYFERRWPALVPPPA